MGIIQPAVNPTARPVKDNNERKKGKKSKKEMEYNLGCWSLWWQRMEREGVKEMMARRVVEMQHPIRNFMTGRCTEKISSIASRLVTHTRTNSVKVRVLLSNGCQQTTPQKRKSDTRMNPELTQCHSDVGSPAKRQRLNNLINFLGGGANMKTQFMNSHASSNSNSEETSNIHITETHTWQKTCSEDNPGGGRGVVEG